METTATALLIIAGAATALFALLGAFLVGLVIAGLATGRMLRKVGLKIEHGQVVPIAGAWPKEIVQSVLRQAVGGFQDIEMREINDKLKVQ